MAMGTHGSEAGTQSAEGPRGAFPADGERSAFVVYASTAEGTAWREVGVFDSVAAADRRAAEVVEAPREEPPGWGEQGKLHGGVHVLNAPWEATEALVVELPADEAAPRELPLEAMEVTRVRSRFTRGAPAPGPAMELSEESAFQSPGQP